MKRTVKLTKGFRKAISLGLVVIAAAASLTGCNGKIYSALFETKMMQYLPFLLPKIESIAITPGTETRASGTTVDFDVSVTYDDGSTRELSQGEMNQVTWSWLPDTNPPIGGVSYVNVTLPPVPPATIGDTVARFTAIKSDYLGADEILTLTADFMGFTATAQLTINDAQLVSIRVDPPTASITRFATRQFTAYGTYTDGGEYPMASIPTLTWDSSNDTYATIDAAGLATGQYTGAGTVAATITAEDTATAISGTATLNVSAPTLSRVSVSPVTKTIANGTYVQLNATAIYSNNTTQDVTDAATWSVIPGGDGTDTTVTTNGLVQGIDPGSDTIQAEFGGMSGTSAITVTAATLQYMVISAAEDKTSIVQDMKLQFSVLGVYSDNSTQDLTYDPSTTWNSTNTAIAEFLTGTDPAGLITAQAPGATVVRASNGAINSQDYNLTVINKTIVTLDSITIYPPNTTVYVIAYGTTVQFTATAHFSDGSSQNITNQVTWLSSNGSVASINSLGMASTTGEGTTNITANYPKSPALPTHTDTTGLQVIAMTLSSISITPTSKADAILGNSFQYTARGTYTDGSDNYIIDITNLVLWESDDTNLDVSNSAGSYGLATPLSVGDGSATVTASLGGATSNSSVVTIAASDIEAPIMQLTAQLLAGEKVRVTFSEPMDHTTAMDKDNYKILTSSTVTGSCSTSDNNFFDNNTGTITIDSVTFYTQSVYILNLTPGQLSNTQYTVIGDRADLRDIAGTPNALACPNKSTFNGIDTVKPYVVSVVNSEPNKIIVKFSEAMLTGGGTAAADRPGNYTVDEVISDGIPENNLTWDSITMIDESTFRLDLNQDARTTQYRITVNSAVGDLADPINTMGTPRILTFQGQEPIKVLSAETAGLNSFRVIFSKPVRTGDNDPNSAECNDVIECEQKYKVYPLNGAGTKSLLGDITSATLSTDENETNIVIVTHDDPTLSFPQEGIAYTVVAANGVDGDGFNNVSDGIWIYGTAGASDKLQTSPRDRATFVGSGDVIDEIKDGEYFTDPFADGSSFTWSFVYAGRVYLGTNDYNSGAFRFDPNGFNSVLVDFDFVDGIISPTCADSTMFGYGTSPVCGTSMGYFGERGVVGFTSGIVTPSGTPYEILMVGPIKNGITGGYYTQDTDTTLDWKYSGFSITGGSNSDSLQTVYAVDNHVYYGLSSSLSTQSPIVTHHTVTETAGVVTVATGDNNLDMPKVPGIGGAPAGGNPATYIGVDSILNYKSYLYMANNGGIRFSSNFTTDFDSNSVLSTPSTQADSTLWLPGLEKVSPGRKGVPILLEFNGYLFMARNVTDGSPDYYDRIRGELWVCDPAIGGTPTTCEPTEWTRIISGTEADLPNSGAGLGISLLQNNGNDRLYVGFDDTATGAGRGASVWRIATTTVPEATSLHGNRMDFNDADDNTGWVRQGDPGLGNNHTIIFSSATISDGTYDYIYMTAGDGTNAIRVYRQREPYIP
ncbi:MAG: Ig-like domain-containing protein [Bacteroidota bacterium]|nr:Ig-like domain-containing protein [Bacteroidota bacterium]